MTHIIKFEMICRTVLRSFISFKAFFGFDGVINWTCGIILNDICFRLLWRAQQ